LTGSVEVDEYFTAGTRQGCKECSNTESRHGLSWRSAAPARGRSPAEHRQRRCWHASPLRGREGRGRHNGLHRRMAALVASPGCDTTTSLRNQRARRPLGQDLTRSFPAPKW